jgi:hypothetical protein
MVITYLRREDFGFFGWFASDRFFLHLPDFVLSLSFDHLPFFTLGTGKKITSLAAFSTLAFLFLTIYVFGARRRRQFSVEMRSVKRKLKLSLFFYWKLLLCFQAVEDKKPVQLEESAVGKS